jgi:hypothetical protein
MQRAALSVAMAFVLALSTSALATSGNHEVVAQIRFTGRQVCWTYRGSATSFIGKFSSGQTVSAQLTGEAIDYDPRSGRAVTVSRPRDPNAEGPGGSSTAFRTARAFWPSSPPLRGVITSASRFAQCGGRRAR